MNRPRKSPAATGPIQNKLHVHITSPRQRRLLSALLFRPVTRKECDAIAHASNGPDVVSKLRNAGLEIVTERVPFTTCDGNASWYGRYRFTGDRAEARKMLEATK